MQNIIAIIEDAQAHTESAIIEVANESEQQEALDQILTAADEADYATEQNGSIDVWGTLEDGSEFRANIRIA